MEGPKAIALHDFIHNGFREMGVNTSTMEKVILEEISKLIAVIQEQDGGPFNYVELGNPTTSSIIARNVFGHRWAPLSKEYAEFMDGAAEAYQLMGGSPVQV